MRTNRDKHTNISDAAADSLNLSQPTCICVCKFALAICASAKVVAKRARHLFSLVCLFLFAICIFNAASLTPLPSFLQSRFQTHPNFRSHSLLPCFYFLSLCYSPWFTCTLPLSLSLQLCTALGNEMTCQACIFPHPNLTSTRFANLLVVANAHIARTHPQ